MAACTAPAPGDPSEDLSIAPRDFVLLPCGPARSDQPCALVAAGGKRVLFGAPAGVAATLSEADLRQLDSVVLFSLRATDIEGVDEIRNESWRAGRATPLLTIGPRGVLVLVDGLNTAFEQADALRIVEDATKNKTFVECACRHLSTFGGSTKSATPQIGFSPAPIAAL